MHFEKSGVYHIYNQGNNRQLIFFKQKNYRFFVEKISTYVLPYTDIMAWCLMPNHFHLLAYVNEVELPKEIISPKSMKPATHSADISKAKVILLNHSIGIMLASYTRAINIQENRSGSLFRSETKSICTNDLKGLDSNWYTDFGVSFMNVQIPEKQYLQTCFNYIHNNPVKAGLVKKAEDWEYSSYAELKGIRDRVLVNKSRVIEFGLVI